MSDGPKPKEILSDPPTGDDQSAPGAPVPRISYTYRGEGTGWVQVALWQVGKMFLQVIAVLFFHVRIAGRKNIPRRGGALLVTNHQSLLDPWLIGIALARQIHYMARESLFNGGWLQYVFERTNAFPVRRGRADSAAMREAIARLDKGYLVNIFPEATRTTDGTIGPIAAGVAIIVRRARAPVIPIVIEGAFEAWPRGRRWPRLRSIRLLYGREIPHDQLAGLSADEIAVRIRREMIQLQQRLQSPHAEASRKRFESDMQAGRRRLVVSRELSA
jgi:1-acyl-sn-glycerol-3-phosphate acyltransferase